jgi:hypothetical protein
LEFIDVFEKTAFAEENSMLSLENINLFVWLLNDDAE